jgi:hypothetical protein
LPKSVSKPLQTLQRIAIIRAMINSCLADTRTWAVCLMAYCAACTSAVACIVPPSPTQQTSIFFEYVPTDIEAPVVIEATIYHATDVSNASGIPITLMNARVDRVIRGTIDAKYLKIFVYINSCTHVGVGRGIVLGRVRDDPQRGIMLEAIQRATMGDWSEEFSEKYKTIHHAAKCEKNQFGVRECRLSGVGPDRDRP